MRGKERKKKKKGERKESKKGMRRVAMASTDPLLIGRWQGYAFLASLRICPHCHFNFNPLGAIGRVGRTGREGGRDCRTHAPFARLVRRLGNNDGVLLTGVPGEILEIRPILYGWISWFNNLYNWLDDSGFIPESLRLIT